MAQLNHERAEQGWMEEANWAARQSREAYDSINRLNDRYNRLLDGKWNHMMMLAPGWVAKYQNMPRLALSDEVGEKEVDIMPCEEQGRLEGCTVVDLAGYTRMDGEGTHSLKVVEGIGYDGCVLQLGEAVEASVNPEDPRCPHVEYALPDMAADSVTVHVYTLPFFPIYKGKGTRFGISVDDHPVQVAQNLPKEFSKAWKDQVLRNGAVATFRFPINAKRRRHKLAVVCGDPGVMVQRVVVDWGGLQDTYVGPALSLVRGE